MRLPTNGASAVHNVGVTRLAPRSPLRARLGRTAAVLLAASLALAGCGAEETPKKTTPSVTLPTGNVNVPTGVTLTKAGAELTFGETATVAYEPNAERNTVLEMTVTAAQQGAITDLGSYVLDDRTKASVPYYVNVTVKNVGDGDVGQTPIPLWAVDNANTLIQASSFTNSFAPCPSTPLPTTFAPNATVSSCLVYLVPDGGTLTGLSFRPLQAVAPIVWTGTVTPPVTSKKKAS